MIKMTPPEGKGDIEVPDYKVKQMEDNGWKRVVVVNKTKTVTKKEKINGDA
jgi:hypothetical protein|tara:strand:- start:1482 stop:1634 length:153 start_codon:yes stop_codon:yes gene_type:complete